MPRWLTQRHRVILDRAFSQGNYASSAATAINRNPIPDHLDEGLPPAPSTIPTRHVRSAEARSLARALLRECGYLPDVFARQWVRLHVLASFRKHESKAQRLRDDERERKKIKDGRQALSQLRRAALGSSRILEKVLMMAYGRTGKRRRELLQSLLQKPTNGSPDATANEGVKLEHTQDEDTWSNEGESNEQDPAPENVHKPLPIIPTSATKYQPPTLPHQLKSLLLSQIQRAPPTITRNNPRSLKPAIPELNTWLRPMPQKRIKNMYKQHYAKLLSRALPPLQRDEWERIRDFASGKVELEMPNRRRGPSSLTIPARSALDMTVQYGKLPNQVIRPQAQYETSPRTMRRLYAKVFSQCPLMEFDKEQQTWRVTWGEQAMLRRHQDLPS